MATETITIKVKIKLVNEEPDGSECYACGDSCFMNQSRIHLKLSTGSKLKTNFVFCQSCKPELE